MTPFVLWIVLLPTAASKFVLKLTPKNPMARVGDRLVLTCSASDCAEAVTFTWGSLLDQPLNGKTETNGSVSLQIFNPLGVKHRNKVVCKATCRTTTTEQKAQMSTEVKVYALPKDPTLSRSDLLTEGQESNLTCTVPDVYPADSLIIEWLLGDEVLLKQDGHLDGQMVTSVFKYRPTAQNNGQNVTCRATLDNRITRETVASMTVQYSPRNTTISGNTQVNIGDSFTLTCRAEGNPEPTVLWRRLDQDGRSVVEGEGMTLLVEEASWSHGGEYECVAHNVVGNQTAHMTVNVQGPPEKPVLYLSPSGELKAMDSVTITCQSESGPQGRVALRQVTGGQGAELQSNQSHTSTSITVQLLTAKNSGLYECQVTNPYGKQTSSINLTVSAPPTNLSTEFKEGQNVTVWRPAVGVPAPSATLVRLQDGVEPHSSDGSFHLVPEQDKPVSAKAIIIPAMCSVSIVTAAAILIRFLRRAKTSSSYEVARIV